ncbi:MAG: metabolite traffic protein EboE [Limisphaerales bacterium]
MQLKHNLHLAYCTNVHRGETWAETLASLEQYTLAVKQRVSPTQSYAIGLRLSAQAAYELSKPEQITAFRRWLDKNGCYVFTINGFPFGRFHGERVKEQVYLPDWTSTERVDFTNLLFDILAQLVPAHIEGSVSTVPGSFKEFVKSAEQLRVIRANVFRSVEHAARVSAQTGRRMHLALEPEPMCLFETTHETAMFFERVRAEHNHDHRINEHLGVNYDTCHIAVEFEEPADAIAELQKHNIRISKLHLSSALKIKDSPEGREALSAFAESTYLHQVVARGHNGKLTRYRDLPDALNTQAVDEWRVHFHVPLHWQPTSLLDNTTDHLIGILDILRGNPALCSHLEMETYTWEVMPPEVKSRDVVDQLASEYDWTLARLRERSLA